MIYVIAIDPGLDGAIAMLNEKGQLISVQDTPTTAVKKKGKAGKKRLYLPSQMLAITEALDKTADGEVRLVGIENVHVRPINGAHAAFGLGRSLGLWEMAAVARGWPTEWLDPGKWKREMIGPNTADDKQASIVRALQLFPKAADHLTLKKHDGRAEAILMAAYLLRRLIPGFDPHRASRRARGMP